MFNQFSFSSLLTGARADTTSNFTDWELIRAGRGELLSLFGYNSGAAQFIQIFDSAVGPVVTISATVAATDIATAASHGLHTGQRVHLPSDLAGVTAGIYYVNKISANTLYLYDTKANAITGGASGRANFTGVASGTLNLIPKHTFAIGGADNFSCVIPVTGLGFDNGVVVANSSTGPLYTAGSKDVTYCATLKA